MNASQPLRMYTDVLDSAVASHSEADPSSDHNARSAVFAQVLRRYPHPRASAKRVRTFVVNSVTMNADPALCGSSRIWVRVTSPGGVLVRTRTGSVVFSYGLASPGKGFGTTNIIDNVTEILVVAFRAFVERSDFQAASVILDLAVELERN